MSAGIQYGDEFGSQESSAAHSYVDALRDYLDAPGAPWMERARELGAAGVRSGWDVSHVLVVHQDALAICVGRIAAPETKRKSILRAGAFLEEVLRPFEMLGDHFSTPLFATRPSSMRLGDAASTHRMSRDREHAPWTPTAAR